jgi:hypothetical protein
MKRIVCGLVLSCALLAGMPMGQARATGPYAPDNTGINVRDRNSGAMTAGEQSNSSGDLALTQRIRKSIMKDHSLSMMAKNVKIVSAHGSVTLRGPVKTEKEKSRVAAKAQTIAGVDRVDDQLEVKRVQVHTRHRAEREPAKEILQTAGVEDISYAGESAPSDNSPASYRA